MMNRLTPEVSLGELCSLIVDSEHKTAPKDPSGQYPLIRTPNLGTLFIGVGDDQEIVDLDHDVPLVKPPNADGFVNWLTTHLINAIRHSAVMRTRTRIEQIETSQICRVDIASSSVPVRARMSDGDEVFWVRMNNSTRALPETEADVYIRDRWSSGP